MTDAVNWKRTDFLYSIAEEHFKRFRTRVILKVYLDNNFNLNVHVLSFSYISIFFSNAEIQRLNLQIFLRN